MSERLSSLDVCTKAQAVSRLTTLLLVLACGGRAAGQGESEGQPTTLSGFAPRLLAPAPTRVEPLVPSFIESLGATSATIEVKIGQGRFLTLKEDLAAAGPRLPFIAVGDPTVVDFYKAGPRQIRLIGKHLGTTDLSITTGSGKTYEFEVQVVADLDVLRGQLRAMFPDAGLKLAQLREKIVVEGQARDAAQVSRIVDAIESYVRSIQRVQVANQVGDAREPLQVDAVEPNLPNAVPLPPLPQGANPAGNANPNGAANVIVNPNGTGLSSYVQSETNAGFVPGVTGGTGNQPTAGNIALGKIATNQSPVINLLRVPTSQQVLLKVRVAELNRTGFRQIGADLLATIPQFGTLFGTQIAGNGLNAGSVGDRSFFTNSGTSGQPVNLRSLNLGPAATAYGTFSHGQFNAVLTALRKNSLLKILAEPNLVALNGHQANFLAGGEFPVPSFSGVGAGSPTGGGTSSTQFKEFGVRLSFLPIIIDGETVRLTVDPEVSSVDFSIATTLVPGGSPVPGLNVRKSHTTVELKQGETLAIAGLMQLDLDGSTQKIPGLGDLPYIGAFFSNTTSNRIEKELIVLVTPYIIEPMAPGQVPPVPGDEVKQPNDLEFFFLNRIEGRTGIDGRSTTSYDDPLHLVRHSIVERKYLIGPSGFSK
ncbi:MAG: pulD [Planctomycetota bacterium]|nr:pulD [Planctomycetota bacterium]